MAPRIETLLAAGDDTSVARPWPRAEVDGAAWQAAIDRLASGDWMLFGLWGDPARSTWRVLDARRRARHRQPGLRRRRLPVGRRKACAGDPARARDRGLIRTSSRQARRIPAAGSTTAAGA